MESYGHAQKSVSPIAVAIANCDPLCLGTQQTSGATLKRTCPRLLESNWACPHAKPHRQRGYSPVVEDHLPQAIRVERRAVTEAESRQANGPDWDRYADEYQATHGAFLGDAGFRWGPEGHTEDSLGVLGDVTGKRVLEVGSGAGQCSRWIRKHGGHGVGLDLSHRQLQHSLRLDGETEIAVPSVRATATQLPFGPGVFDIVFSSFGALQFVSEDAVGEVRRVLRPQGCFAFSITHPTRWMFPDDPGELGLTATQSYWDRTPYVEVDPATNVVSYVEHHRTLGDWVALLSSNGFALRNLFEPEWPEAHDRVWGGWSPIRGALTPGTAIFVADAAS